MNKGDFAKTELTITPAANGSYLVRRGFGPESFNRPSVSVNEMIAFSNYSDLLAFLTDDYRSANQKEG